MFYLFFNCEKVIEICFKGLVKYLLFNTSN